MKSRDVMIWKAIALGAVIIYIYKARKENGGTLAQNPYGINLNPERVADFASRFAPPEYRVRAKHLGQVLIERFIQ